MSIAKRDDAAIARVQQQVDKMAWRLISHFRLAMSCIMLLPCHSDDTGDF